MASYKEYQQNSPKLDQAGRVMQNLGFDSKINPPLSACNKSENDLKISDVMGFQGINTSFL